MTTDTDPIVYEVDALGRRLKCANPWCAAKVRVHGEHCRPCWRQQEQQRHALRQQRARPDRPRTA